MTRSCALWVVRAPETPQAEHLAFLDGAERTTNRRFRHAGRRARHACGRALLRRVLAHLLDLSPEEIAIAPGRHGRPELAGAARAAFPGVDFNLSSTPGFVACAVATGWRVGVDIEHTDRAAARARDRSALEERVLTDAERRWLDRQPDRATGFHRLWTLKEALAKADGIGLGLPFDRLCLRPGDDGRLEIDDSRLDDGEPSRSDGDSPRGHGDRGNAPRFRAGRLTLYSYDAGVPVALALLGDGRADGLPRLSPAVPGLSAFEEVPLRLIASGP